VGAAGACRFALDLAGRLGHALFERTVVDRRENQSYNYSIFGRF
jgi:hypothetical protein